MKNIETSVPPVWADELWATEYRGLMELSGVRKLFGLTATDRCGGGYVGGLRVADSGTPTGREGRGGRVTKETSRTAEVSRTLASSVGDQHGARCRRWPDVATVRSRRHGARVCAGRNKCRSCILPTAATAAIADRSLRQGGRYSQNS